MILDLEPSTRQFQMVNLQICDLHENSDIYTPEKIGIVRYRNWWFSLKRNQFLPYLGNLKVAVFIVLQLMLHVQTHPVYI